MIYIADLQTKFNANDLDAWVNLTEQALLNAGLMEGLAETLGVDIDEVHDELLIPVSNHIRQLPAKPSDDMLLDLASRTTNVVVIQDNEGNCYTAVTVTGIDCSNDIQYIHNLIKR